MDFEASAFIGLAEELLKGLSGAPAAKSNPDQARIRASIGRSYYGAYLLAREKVRSSATGVVLKGDSQDHERVIVALGGRESELGGMLHRLRDKRNDADYRLSPKGFTLVAGEFWLSIAKDVAEQISTLDKS